MIALRFDLKPITQGFACLRVQRHAALFIALPVLDRDTALAFRKLDILHPQFDGFAQAQSRMQQEQDQ
jgi:hypothetical protein